jgi:hypothetical protein
VAQTAAAEVAKVPESPFTQNLRKAILYAGGNFSLVIEFIFIRI